MIKRTCPILQSTFDCALEIIRKIFHFSKIDLQCLKITLKFKCLRGIKESKRASVSKLQQATEVVMALHGQGSNAKTNWLVDSRNWPTFASPMFDRCAILRFVIYLTIMNPESLCRSGK